MSIGLASYLWAKRLFNRDRRPSELASGMRSRELGISFGTADAGPLDAITDVAGVRVGRSRCSRAMTCGRA